MPFTLLSFALLRMIRLPPLSASHRSGGLQIETDFPAAGSLEEGTFEVICSNKLNSSSGSESISHTICFE
jgi:hypothetical protein